MCKVTFQFCFSPLYFSLASSSPGFLFFNSCSSKDTFPPFTVVVWPCRYMWFSLSRSGGSALFNETSLKHRNRNTNDNQWVLWIHRDDFSVFWTTQTNISFVFINKDEREKHCPTAEEVRGKNMLFEIWVNSLWSCASTNQSSVLHRDLWPLRSVQVNVCANFKEIPTRCFWHITTIGGTTPKTTPTIIRVPIIHKPLTIPPP